MAISASNKITASDVNTALGTKIDTAGTGLSKSGTTLALATVVTAGNAGPTANATLSYSGTFTVPYITYDAYGRVTGRTNRTMTMPAASSGSDNCAKFAAWDTYYHRDYIKLGDGTFVQGSFDSECGYYFTKWTAPSGGTWQVVSMSGFNSKRISGGTSIENYGNCIAIRVA